MFIVIFCIVIFIANFNRMFNGNKPLNLYPLQKNQALSESAIWVSPDFLDLAILAAQHTAQEVHGIVFELVVVQPEPNHGDKKEEK